MPAKYIAAFANVLDDEGYKDAAFAQYRQQHGINDARRLGDMPLKVVSEVLRQAQVLKGNYIVNSLGGDERWA
jgi:hypothetical protein